MKYYSKSIEKKGFTLIEMVIAVPLFLIIATASSAAYLNVAKVNRAAQASRAAFDNLSVVFEDMARTIKTGTTFYCWNGSGGPPPDPTPVPQDCTGGNAGLAFLDQEGRRVVYYMSGGSLYKRWYYRDPSTGAYSQSNTPAVLLSSTKFNITNPTRVFYVRGAGAPPNYEQPQVLINLQGTATAFGVTRAFNIQTIVTQRAYDG